MNAMADDVGVSTNKKMRLSREKDELWNTSREELVNRVIRQQQEIDDLAAKQANDTSLDELRETVEKLKLQVAESTRQESLLVMRLAAKEQEVQELLGQISDLKQALNPSSAQLQSMLLDPAVNLLFTQMKHEMDTCRSQLEQSQKDLAAWKFTPDSQTGKRLMAKCRMLLQENEDLGRSMSSGRIAKLEGDIALQKRLIEEMKNSEKETEEFLGDVDEDLEAMQGTVYLLQQELKDAKERLQQQQLELDQLRARTATSSNVNSVPATACGELTTTTVNVMTADSSEVPMKQVGKMSSELLRTAGKDNTRILEDKLIKKESCEDAEASPLYGNRRTALDDGSRTENMDVDHSETAAKCSYMNDMRTSLMQHMNDDAMSSEQLTDEGGLHKTMIDGFRTVSKVGATELTASDCVPNGTDDDKALTVAGN